MSRVIYDNYLVSKTQTNKNEKNINFEWDKSNPNYKQIIKDVDKNQDLKQLRTKYKNLNSK